jgi:hypothetical protein
VILLFRSKRKQMWTFVSGEFGMFIAWKNEPPMVCSQYWMNVQVLRNCFYRVIQKLGIPLYTPIYSKKWIWMQLAGLRFFLLGCCNQRFCLNNNFPFHLLHLVVLTVTS